MKQRIILHTANLHQGGALQVASSFIKEASKITDIDFYVVLGKYTSLAIDQGEYIANKNIKFFTINFHPRESLKKYFRYQFVLHGYERKVKPDAVISVFGPIYWMPRSPHIMGFANGNLLYEDTYFFRLWQGWQTISYKLKKYFHQWLLKREADFYWVETADSKKRLARFLNKPMEKIIIASNNCSNYFRDTKYEVLEKLPPKKALRLIYISSYYPHKGFELIPPVLHRLKKDQIAVELIVTINQKDFERIFQEFDNVINLGAVEPKYCPFLYQQSDIVFAPTLLETFSAMYPEAMYMQKPILTTDLPFAHNICEEAALFFNPESVEDSAEKLKLLIYNKDLRENLVKKGLERIKEFDLPEERFKKIVEKVMGFSASTS